MKEIKDDLVQAGFAIQAGRRDELHQIDLPAIAEQLSAIAAELRGESAQLLPLRSSNAERDLRQHLHRTRSLPENSASLEQRRILYAEFARESYATRRRRSRIFQNNELFGEPAWDILLDLYIAHVEKKSVSVSSACIGTADDGAALARCARGPAIGDARTRPGGSTQSAGPAD